METTGKDIGIAGVKTTAAAAWALLVTLFVSSKTELEPIAYVAIQTVATGAITVIGNALQEAKNRVANVLGRILLLVDQTPTYTPPDND